MIRFLTAGESHGPELTAIVEGIPAGLPLDVSAINQELARRQKGYGSGGRMRIEHDTVRISAGAMGGKTTGAPLALHIPNRDFKNWHDKEIPPMTIPRPGHADLTGAIKYGYTDLRLALERASARETALRVAVGAITKQFLAQLGIQTGGYVVQIGRVTAGMDPNLPFTNRFHLAEKNTVRCPDESVVKAMENEIRAVKKAGDTVGGIIEVVALNVPPGIGSYVQWDRRLEGMIAQAMLSIPAMKGVEIGPGFENAGKWGSDVHDAILLKPNQHLGRKTNRAGGVEGGISTGEPLLVRVAMKPIATVLKGFDSVDLATGLPAKTVYERSDFCAVPRAVPIVEAMLAIVLTNALLEKLGGDSMAEIKPRFEALRRAYVPDLPMDNVPWRFDY
ncbi:MAG: chorismate synthase [Gemmatimonadetes bacterium]|nr:MAG: chorismate synthase [Gemmatimonadota bacterium]